MSILNWGLIIMALKRKRIFRRLFAPVLILAICISCFAVTALADDFDLIDNWLDVSAFNNFKARYRLDADNDYTCSFDLPEYTYIYGIDFVCRAWDLPSEIVCISGTGSRTSLTIVSLGSGMYRVYGDLPGSNGAYTFSLEMKNTKNVYVLFESMYVSLAKSFVYPDVGCMIALPSDYQSEWKFMPNSSTPLNIDLDVQNQTHAQDTYNYPFLASVGIPYWDKYDFVDIMLKVDSAGIESVTAEFNGLYIMDRISVIDSGVPAISEENSSSENINTIESWQWVLVRVDLRGLQRSVDSMPVINVTGAYYGSDSKIQLTSVNGILAIEPYSETSFWWEQVTEFFTDLFGADDAQQEVIDQVQQNQADLNVSVNEQISSSVDSWNVNITTVKGSYDTAYQNTLPALLWLSSFANGIFNGMGWYANIFYMIGFVGIVALILSKSGLGSKIKKM